MIRLLIIVFNLKSHKIFGVSISKKSKYMNNFVIELQNLKH